jgi:hypothetical protein
VLGNLAVLFPAPFADLPIERLLGAFGLTPNPRRIAGPFRRVFRQDQPAGFQLVGAMREGEAFAAVTAIAQGRAQIAVARRKIEDREKYRLGGLVLAAKLNGWSEDALKAGFARRPRFWFPDYDCALSLLPEKGALPSLFCRSLIGHRPCEGFSSKPFPSVTRPCRRCARASAAREPRSAARRAVWRCP